MVPKWSRRPCGSCVVRLPFLVFSLVLSSAIGDARADGSAVPVLDAKPPRAIVGTPVRASIAVGGGSGPYRFELVSGALPAGLSLARDGKISGTPIESGSVTFTVRVTDSAALPSTVVQTYVMVVQDRPDPTADPSTVGMLNQQAGTARGFAFTQIGNFQTRLESLRSSSGGRCADDEARPSLATIARTPKPVGLMEQPQQDQSLNMPIDNCRRLADRATTLWTAGALNVGSNRGQSGAGAFRFDSQGMTLGGDFALRPNLVFGAGVGVARDESEMVPAGGTANSAYGGAVAGYLSYRPFERFYVDAVMGVGDVASDSTRMAASGGMVYGTRPADQRFISISAGHRFASADWQVVPYTRVDHVRATLRALNESGATGEALGFSEEKVPSLKWAAGASAATSFSTPFGVLLPRTSLEYRRELERFDAGSVRYVDVASGPSYSIMPNANERDSTSLGLGANLLLVNRWNLGVSSTINRSNAANSTRIDATVGRVF